MRYDAFLRQISSRGLSEIELVETVQNIVPRADFWRGKRVLLTGHTGFKGSWAALWLGHLGAEVTGLALDPPSTPNLYTLVGGPKDDLRVDIRDSDAVLKVAERLKPEIVIHMAAQALVRTSYGDPVATYATNVMGTVNLLEAIRRVGGTRVIVNITSDKCYENREWLWAYREDEPFGGHDPYSSSKGCAELVTSAYRRSYFTAPEATVLASARAGNVIGGGDWAIDRIVPDCIRAFTAGRPVAVRNPRAVRPWQHVLEPISGYLLLAEQMWEQGQAVAEGWNFAPAEDSAKPVSYIVDELARLWGPGAKWHQIDTMQPHEVGYLKIDASKARARLGWSSRFYLDTALDWTVDWYLAQHQGADARQLCLDQIARYEGIVSDQ